MRALQEESPRHSKAPLYFSSGSSLAWDVEADTAGSAVILKNVGSNGGTISKGCPVDA